MEQELQHTPALGPLHCASSHSLSHSPSALAVPAGSRGRVGAPAFPKGHLSHHSPWPVLRETVETSREQEEQRSLQPCKSSAHPRAALQHVLHSWGISSPGRDVAGRDTVGRDTPGRVAGGGRCWLPRSSLSAGLRHTSAALGSSKLQPGLLLMFKKTEANGRRIISQINKGQRSGIDFFILLKSSLKAFLDNSPGCSAGCDVAVSGVPGKGQPQIFNQFSAGSVRPFVPRRPRGAGGTGRSPPGWR